MSEQASEKPIVNASNTNEKSGGADKQPPKKKARYCGMEKKRRWDFRSRHELNEEQRANFRPEDRVKKRKYLLILGYNGANYTGMQRNPEVNTIEEELLKAMLKHKWISEEGFKQPQMVHFQRAARTDKGVSAARQCISAKLPEKLDIDAFNTDLPADIKIFGVKRVTKGFNAKDQCNARSYSYTLPTIAFSEYDDKATLQEYRVPQERIDRVNELLKIYIGHKNFHNFTSRKPFADPSSIRQIQSFECSAPYMVKDVEFATILVKGQSFMMHQIRKMIGLVLVVVRGLADEEIIARAFKEPRVDVPMAPGLGLVLDQVHYDHYNGRYGADGMHELLLWDEFEPAIKEFRDNFIQPKILETELADGTMLNWLPTLELHSYDEVKGDKQNGANVVKSAETTESNDSTDSPPEKENTDDATATQILTENTERPSVIQATQSISG